MIIHLSRRAFLAGCAAAGTAACLPAGAATATTESSRRLIAGRRSIDVNGRAADVYGLTDQSGRSGLILGPGERFEVALNNGLDEDTSIHWHGMTPAPDLDGIAETGYVTPLAAGGTRHFDFVPRPGTHWMHSHHGLQEQSLLTAPLIVMESDMEDVQEVVVMLNDFSFRSPAEILAGLTSGSGMSHGAMNGAMGMAGMMNHADMANMDAMGGMDLNDVSYDAFLANDRTLGDPEVVRAERNGRLRLRIINGAASTAFWIDLGSHAAQLVAVDGNPVVPLMGSRFPLTQGQRMDLLVDIPAGAVVPVFARREGDVARTGIVLAAPGAQVPKYAQFADQSEQPVDLSLEQQLIASAPLAPRPVDNQLMVMLGGAMSPYAWTLNGQNWEAREPLRVVEGQRVSLGIMNHSMMAHPMHLHGHHFQVVGVNSLSVAGAIRDTVLVPPMSTVTVAFDADNPGRWLYHCHNLYHMAAGMMSELVYA